MNQLAIHDATAADVPILLSMIRSLAEFEKLTVRSTEESLRTALFGDPPLAHALLVCMNGEPAGYATYFFTFASMSDKPGLWLDDLFVMPAFRSRGIGRAIMARLADVAVQHQCARMEWNVLDWNENAMAFYNRLGARMLNAWRTCRLEESQFSNLTGAEASES